MNKFKEIERKYDASKIPLEAFLAFAKSLKPKSCTIDGSFDHYFENKKHSFIRYRAGKKPELTTKIKIKGNFVRKEPNVPLDSTISEIERLGVVKEFCTGIGFSHNFSIYKKYYVYHYTGYEIVYYIVFSKAGKEKGRFIEIEMDESFPWKSIKQACAALIRIQDKCSEMGISSRNIIKHSLYELFRKKRHDKR